MCNAYPLNVLYLHKIWHYRILYAPKIKNHATYVDVDPQMTAFTRLHLIHIFQFKLLQIQKKPELVFVLPIIRVTSNALLKEIATRCCCSAVNRMYPVLQLKVSFFCGIDFYKIYSVVAKLWYCQSVLEHFERCIFSSLVAPIQILLK